MLNDYSHRTYERTYYDAEPEIVAEQLSVQMRDEVKLTPAYATEKVVSF